MGPLGKVKQNGGCDLSIGPKAIEISSAFHKYSWIRGSVEQSGIGSDQAGASLQGQLLIDSQLFVDNTLQRDVSEHALVPLSFEPKHTLPVRWPGDLLEYPFASNRSKGRVRPPTDRLA